MATFLPVASPKDAQNQRLGPRKRKKLRLGPPIAGAENLQAGAVDHHGDRTSRHGQGGDQGQCGATASYGREHRGSDPASPNAIAPRSAAMAGQMPAAASRRSRWRGPNSELTAPDGRSSPDATPRSPRASPTPSGCRGRAARPRTPASSPPGPGFRDLVTAGLATLVRHRQIIVPGAGGRSIILLQRPTHAAPCRFVHERGSTRLRATDGRDKRVRRLRRPPAQSCFSAPSCLAMNSGVSGTTSNVPARPRSLAVGYLVLACLFFGAVYKIAIRSGLIARYSAESVS